MNTHKMFITLQSLNSENPPDTYVKLALMSQAKVCKPYYDTLQSGQNRYKLAHNKIHFWRKSVPKKVMIFFSKVLAPKNIIFKIFDDKNPKIPNFWQCQKFQFSKILSQFTLCANLCLFFPVCMQNSFVVNNQFLWDGY